MEKLNVLLLMVDDMIPVLGTHREAHIVPTPNLDRLARRGVLFQNAHTSAPICNPARTALFTGLYPYSSGVYGNGQWWRPALPNLMSLPEHFRDCGYEAVGCGKLYHHTLGFNPPEQWDAYRDIRYDDMWDRANAGLYGDAPVSEPDGFPFHGLDCRLHEFDWGALPKTDSEYGDFVAVDYACDFLSEDHAKPFFLACGTFHPHLPWYTPKAYYDLIDPALVVDPEVIHPCDWSKIPNAGKRLASVGPQGNNQYEILMENDALLEARRWYYASIAFTDVMIGKVLDALAASAYADDTIVAFVGDHGFHVGEKRHVGKQALWRESTHIPMLLAGPGLPEGSVVDEAVNSVDLGATLAALSGVGGFDDRDSASLMPVVGGERSGTHVVCTHAQKNFAVVGKDWRYIRYEDGTEELYDLMNDSHEQYNVAQGAKFRSIVDELTQFIPTDVAPQAPNRDAYHFDRACYTWTHRA